MAHGSPSRATSRQGLLLGIGYLAFGVFVFSLQDVIIKMISGSYSVHEIVFIRSAVAVPLGLAMLVWELGGWPASLAALRTRRLPRVLLRALLVFGAYTFYYLAIAALPLAEAMALGFTAPLIITLLSPFLLGDRVSLWQWLAVLVGFAGVLLIMRPGTGVFEPASLLLLVSAACYGLAQIEARTLGVTESGSSLSFYTSLLYLVASGVIGLAIGNGAFAGAVHPSLGFLLRAWSLPTQLDLVLIGVLGVIAAVGTYCLAQAYRVARPSLVAPFEYTGIVWPLLWGQLFWQHIPDALSFAGIALVIAAGVSILFSGRAAR